MTIGHVSVPGATLQWSLIDLVPPWQLAPETIVMHHGIGATQSIFAGWLPALVGTHRILRFDMRGHGASTPSDPSVPLDMDLLTDDLFAVMDAAGVAAAHLAGEFIGGTVVLNAALQAPARVRSVSVSNGAHLGASIQSVAGWRQMIETEGMGAWSAFMMQARFYPGALTPAAWQWFQSQQAAACPATVLRLLAALVGTDLTSRLPGLQPPLLLLHPDASPFIPVPTVAALRDLAPNARLHVIGHARHGLPFSHAATCAALLHGFIQAARPSAVDPSRAPH